MSDAPANNGPHFNAVDFRASLLPHPLPGASGPVLNPNSWALVTVSPTASPFNIKEGYMAKFVGYNQDNQPIFEITPNHFVQYNLNHHSFEAVDYPPADINAFNEAERQRVLAAYQAKKAAEEAAAAAEAEAAMAAEAAAEEAIVTP